MSFNIWKIGIHKICESQGRAIIDTEHNEKKNEGKREHELSFSDECMGYRSVSQFKCTRWVCEKVDHINLMWVMGIA